jgi:hypothetical protein
LGTEFKLIIKRHHMSNVQFTEEQNGATPSFGGSDKKKSSMVEWLVSRGIVKDEKKANTVLIVAAIIFFLASIIIFIF